MFAHIRRGRNGRLATFEGGATITFVALLMALSPSAGAITPHVFAAPFRHTTIVQSTSTSSYGTCKRGEALRGTHWLPKTGNITGFGSSYVKGCSSVPSGAGCATTFAGDTFLIGFPFTVYRNGGYNISVNFSFDYTLIALLSGVFHCPPAKVVKNVFTYSSCTMSVEASSFAQVALYDATNKSYLYGFEGSVQLPQNSTTVSNYSYCYNSCYSYNYSYGCAPTKSNFSFIVASCVASGTHVRGTNTTWVNSGSNCYSGYNGRCYQWQNWTLIHSHHYWVLLAIGFYTGASLYNYGGGHSGTASINGATLGNKGWRVNAVTIA